MLDQPLAQLALLLCRCAVEHGGETAVLLDELQRRLFADARHAGNVVRRIAHQALDVDQLRGRKAVGLADVIGRDAHGIGDAALRVEDGGSFAGELKGIAVAGDEHGFAALALAGGGDGAQDVVRLVAGALEHRDAHQADQLADDRILRAQFVRHGLARGLVIGVLLRADRRRVDVERHGQAVRLLVGDDLEEHHHKAVHGVGRRAVRRAHRRLKRVKRPVHQAVAIQQYDLPRHHNVLL